MSTLTLKTRKPNPFFGMPLWPSVLSDFFENDDSSGTVYMRNPRVNISETNEAFQMLFEVPGFKKNDFTIKTEEHALVISGTHKEENKSGDENVFRKEFSVQSFTRRFDLPENVNIEKIGASYEDGILKIMLPKHETKKRIEKEIVIS